MEDYQSIKIPFDGTAIMLVSPHTYCPIENFTPLKGYLVVAKEDTGVWYIFNDNEEPLRFELICFHFVITKIF